MKSAPSLTWRLLLNILIAQLFALGASWAIASVLMLSTASNFSYDYLSMFTARDLVIGSLARDGNGHIYIDARGPLAAEQTRVPKLKYAVFKSLAEDAVPGSSPELAAAIRRMTDVDTRGVDFFFTEATGEKAAGSVWQWNTRVGPLFVATSGSAFRWTDILYYLRNEAPQIGLNLVTMACLSAVAAWIAVSRGLAPLRAAAAAADKLEMDTLGQGIPSARAPAEVLPLIQSINSSLSRLDLAAMRMRRYIATAAHELRTPVAILRARLENPEEPTFRVDLKRDVRRLQAIVEQLLIAARLDARQAKLDEQVDLVAVARSVVGDYAPLAFQAGRSLAFEAPAVPVQVIGNRHAIESMIVNLIDNALRLEPLCGSVTVRVLAEYVVEVEDHGPGVSEGDREAIFEPFWRKTEATRGAGLGLAIVKELADTLGARILVEDTPGGGATFSLRFPHERAKSSFKHDS